MKKNWIVPLLTFSILIIGFEAGLTIFGISTFIFPKPSLILKSLVENWVWILSNLKITLFEALVGFSLSIILGVGLSLAYLIFPKLEQVIVPVAIAIRNVPFVAIAPILFITLGYGPLPKIIIVMVVSFFPIMVNLAAGFNSISQQQRERFYVWRATKWQLFKKLQLPSSIPYLVTGLEIAVSNIIIAAIVGELLGTTKGLGFVIIMSVSQYKFPLLMAAVLITTIVSIMLTWILNTTTKKIFKRWLVT